MLSKRRRPLPQSGGGVGFSEAAEVRGLHSFGNKGPPMLPGMGHCRFVDTRVFTALGQGLPPLWGTGLRRFGETGVCAALGTPGPLPLWGKSLEMSNSHTQTGSEEAYIV